MTRPLLRAALVACLALATACGAPRPDRLPADSASLATPSGDGGRAGSYSAVNPESSGVPARDSVSAEPVNWTVDLVMTRLKSGGLDAKLLQPVTAKHMSAPGARVQVPGAELEIYLYGDANATAQDIDRFDRLMRMPDGALMWEKPPALVTANNMVILIVTSDPAVRERVRRALNLSHMKQYNVTQAWQSRGVALLGDTVRSSVSIG